MSKKNKIVKGGFYLATVNVASQIIAIVLNIILARLLLPEHFGLIALANTYLGFITLVTNIGFGSAIIHYQKSTQEQLSTIYWINFLIAVISFLIVLSTASYVANFYNEPELKLVIRLISINILLTPLFIIHYKIKERDLEFKFLSKITVMATFFGAFMAVVAALYGLGVYSLVIQSLSLTVVKLTLILIYSNWRPSFTMNIRKIYSMIWYSVKYKASDLVLYFERNIDYLVMGKVFNSTTIGYYAFAYNIMYTPVKRISYIFNDILFPSFSSIKDEKSRIIKGYFKSITLISMISFPIMTIIALNANLIIITIFGDKWIEAIPIVQILCFAGAIQSISQVGGVIFSSIGKPEINLYISTGRTLLTVIAILGGVNSGILVVAYLLVIAKVLSFALFLLVLYFNIKFSISSLMSHLIGPMISIVTLFVTNYIFVRFWDDELGKLIVMSLLALLVMMIFHFSEIKGIVKTIIKRDEKH